MDLCAAARMRALGGYVCIAGSALTMGSVAGGRRAMEHLMEIDPAIRLVYAINEPAAVDAYVR